MSALQSGLWRQTGMEGFASHGKNQKISAIEDRAERDEVHDRAPVAIEIQQALAAGDAHRACGGRQEGEQHGRENGEPLTRCAEKSPAGGGVRMEFHWSPGLGRGAAVPAACLSRE